MSVATGLEAAVLLVSYTRALHLVTSVSFSIDAGRAVTATFTSPVSLRDGGGVLDATAFVASATAANVAVSIEVSEPTGSDGTTWLIEPTLPTVVL